jgi:hypothetical protein
MGEWLRDQEVEIAAETGVLAALRALNGSGSRKRGRRRGRR